MLKRIIWSLCPSFGPSAGFGRPEGPFQDRHSMWAILNGNSTWTVFQRNYQCNSREMFSSKRINDICCNSSHFQRPIKHPPYPWGAHFQYCYNISARNDLVWAITAPILSSKKWRNLNSKIYKSSYLVIIKLNFS